MNPEKNIDLPDSAKDKKHLQSEVFELDLPDTIISSDDEEGVGILDDPDEQDEIADQLNANVTKDERKLLDDAAKKVDSPDQTALEQAELDQRDEDGELLNEKTGVSGNDLDVPGSELDDANEEIGEEDEENNSYSLDDEHEDDNNIRQ